MILFFLFTDFLNWKSKIFCLLLFIIFICSTIYLLNISKQDMSDNYFGQIKTEESRINLVENSYILNYIIWNIALKQSNFWCRQQELSHRNL